MSLRSTQPPALCKWYLLLLAVVTQGSWDLLRVTAARKMPSCSEVLSGEGSPEDQQARARDFCSKACRQLYHFHPYFRTNLCLHCFREPHYVFKKK